MTLVVRKRVDQVGVFWVDEKVFVDGNGETATGLASFFTWESLR